MRMFFGFLLLVSFISEASADGNCPDLGSSYNCTAGKYYDSDQQECKYCPRGYYCPEGGIAYCCNEHTNGMFPESTEKSSNIKDCYAKVQCGETEANIYCWNYDDQGNCQPANDVGSITTQITYDDNYYLDFQKKFAILNLAAPYEPYQIPAGYHIENIPKYDVPYHITGSGTWTPTSYEIKCVANTLSCSEFFPDNNAPENCYLYENEPDCTNYGCDWASDYNRCMSFNQIGAYHSSLNCDYPTDSITEEAIWVPDDEVNINHGHWDVSNCKCVNNNDIQDTNRNCFVNGGIHNSVTNGAIATIHSINENIIFNQETNTGESSCKRCLQDTPTIKYYVDEKQFYSNTKFVNKCTAEPNKHGSYRIPAQSNYCGGTITWTDLSQNPCALAPCPMGQTTTDVLPIGADSCKYTTETQFCDSRGCFKLSDIDAWTINP